MNVSTSGTVLNDCDSDHIDQWELGPNQFSCILPTTNIKENESDSYIDDFKNENGVNLNALWNISNKTVDLSYKLDFMVHGNGRH